MNKKAQNEIIGLVMIVVLIVIAGMIFLGISLRKEKGVVQNDAEIMNFLSASLKITTNCSVSFEPSYLDSEGLIKACFYRNKCLSGENPCDLLNNTYGNILDSVWIVNENTKVRGYEFLIYQKSGNVSLGSALLNITKGNNTGCLVKKGSRIQRPDSILIDFDVCYS